MFESNFNFWVYIYTHTFWSFFIMSFFVCLFYLYSHNSLIPLFTIFFVSDFQRLKRELGAQTDSLSLLRSSLHDKESSVHALTQSGREKDTLISQLQAALQEITDKHSELQQKQQKLEGEPESSSTPRG